MRWNQQKIVAALSAVPGTGRVEVSEYPWSEYTTRAIIVYPQGAQPDEDGTGRVYAVGFTTDGNEITTPDDCNVEMVELSDGTDSRGGLQSTDPAVIRLFGEMRIALVGLGATVVDQMKDYF